MPDKKIVKENLPRIAAMLFLASTLPFEIRSILNKETPDHHPNYNIASMLAPMIGVCNITGRIWDHRTNPDKRKNRIAGVGAIMMMLIEMSFSTSTFLSSFKQPIALPLLMGALSLSFVSCVNWEPLASDVEDKSCKALAKKNAGRIAAFNGITIGMGCAITSIALNDERFFYASSFGLNLASMGESSNRVFDITVTHKDTATLLNKACAILFFLIVLANALSNALATAGKWDAPIAFSGIVMHVGLMLYSVAQFNFKRDTNNDALQQSLLPESEAPHSVMRV